MELSTEHALQKGVSAHLLGKLREAESFYRVILESRPDHPEANHNLGLIALSVNQHAAALPLLKRAIDLHPEQEQYWFSYIGALFKCGEIETAERAIEAAKIVGFVIEQQEDFGPDAMSPVGGGEPIRSQLDRLNRHFQNGRFDAASSLAIAVTRAFPYHPLAWNILGVVHLKHRQFDEALDASKTLVRIEPQSSPAHFNLAVCQQEMGQLDDAVNGYIRAIELDTEAVEPASNLASLLTSYAPCEEVSHPIVTVNRKIREIEVDEVASSLISDDHVINLFLEANKIVKNHNLDLSIGFSEIFRRNSVDLNCSRHLDIFARFNIIPEFCFGCYKVQVEPRTLLEHIKLLVIFDKLDLSENNIRKCMVEIRPEIPGFYKGLVYCSDVEQAHQISDELDRLVKIRIAPELGASVKRGCSEYPISYPEYKKINKQGDQPMIYNEEWRSVEEKYDLENPFKVVKNRRPSLNGLTLNDVLIMRNWIDYARGIGDSSIQLLDQDLVSYPPIHKNARARVATYPWPGP